MFCLFIQVPNKWKDSYVNRFAYALRKRCHFFTNLTIDVEIYNLILKYARKVIGPRTEKSILKKN